LAKVGPAATSKQRANAVAQMQRAAVGNRHESRNRLLLCGGARKPRRSPTWRARGGEVSHKKGMPQQHQRHWHTASTTDIAFVVGELLPQQAHAGLSN
jgi:hypothetical protein